MMNGKNHIENTKKLENPNERICLKKNIGIFKGVSIIVGAIVGSGIFVSPIGVLVNANSVGTSFIMWILCGLFSLLGSIVYAELGVMIPKSGGEYIYILNSFGPLMAFVCMWITFVIIGGVSLAANALMFAEYVIKPVFMDCDIPVSSKIMLAIVGLAILSAVNCYSVKWATKVSVVFSICKVSALFSIIIIGFYKLSKGHTDSFNEPFESLQTESGGLAMAFFQGFWAFAGWNYLNYLVDEMENPTRNLPIAIVISLLSVTCIYVCANVAYLSVLSPKDMITIGSSSIAVAVVFAEKISSYYAKVIPIFVGASVFGSMNGEFLSISRLTYAAAKEGHLPQAFAMVSYKCLTPSPAVIILSVTALFFVFTPNINHLIELASFAFCVCAAMAVSCLIYLRKKGFNKEKSFTLPIGIPILFLIVDLFICALTIYDAPKDAFYSLLMMFAGIPLYFIFIVWKNKPKSILKFSDAFTNFVQKILLVVPEDDEKISQNGL